MNQYFKRIIALAMTAVMAFSISGGVSAADSGTATIDTSRSASLTLYKYDLTGAEQDGLWDAQSYALRDHGGGESCQCGSPAV